MPKCHNNKAASVDGVARSASGSPFSKALHIYRPVCRVTGEGSLTYNSVVVYVNQHYIHMYTMLLSAIHSKLVHAFVNCKEFA